MTEVLLNTQAISRYFTTDPLFDELSIGFNAGERLGLIGPNGSGKSSLLKILAGIDHPDEGTVVARNGLNLVYLAQSDQFAPDATVKQVLDAAHEQALENTVDHYRAEPSDSLMIFPDLHQMVSTLSGGWRKRLAIAQALLRQPDLFMMDEPTNHLDLAGVLWLEELLRNADFAFILVSHDRYFLENVTNRIVELNECYPGGYLKVEGNYSEFLRRREEFLSGQKTAELSLSNKVRRENEWLSRGPKARSTKARGRIDQAHDLQDELRALKARNNANKSADISFEGTARKTKRLIEGKNLSKTFGGQMLFEKLDITLSPNGCIGVLGANGSGKSTMLNILTGDLAPDTGTVKRVEGIKIVTFDQQRQLLDPEQTVEYALSPGDSDKVMFQGKEYHIIAWAKRFLFSRDQLAIKVGELSGGEQARVLIANMMAQPADVLLLDEPTNDLDIPTLDVLEESLAAFVGAIVLITHDRYMLDRLSDRILYMDGHGRTEYYSDYSQWQKEELSRAKFVQRDTRSDPNDDTTTSGKVPVSAKSKMTYEERKELQKIEAKLSKAEAAVAEAEQKLAAPEVASNAEMLLQLSAELEEVQTKVNAIYVRWGELEALQ